MELGNGIQVQLERAHLCEALATRDLILARVNGPENGQGSKISPQFDRGLKVSRTFELPD